jgi:DNA-binding MarR family transcriptional regulator
MSKNSEKNHTAASINPAMHRDGLLQWQAYRILEQVLENALTKQQISAPEWKLLGLIADHKELQATEIALIMDVKLPLVTRNISSLKRKKWITILHHQKDRRIKRILIAETGYAKLVEVEKIVRQSLEHNFQGVTKAERACYKTVLKKIVSNGKV